MNEDKEISMQEIKEEISAMRADLHLVKDVIIGNEEYRQQGLIDRIIVLESWKNSLTLRLATISGGATVLVLLGSKAFEYFNKHQ